MNRVIRCDCGFETVGDTDETVVAKAQAHSRDVHGELVPAELLLSLTQTHPRPTAN